MLHIEPLFVARRFTQKKENYYNLSVVANYNRLYTLGATYRLNNDLSPNAISLIGGLQYNKFYFLYSHQLFVADADIANNTEFTVGYRFPLRPSKVFVDNDLDGVINKKDTCPDVFGPKNTVDAHWSFGLLYLHCKLKPKLIPNSRRLSYVPF